MFTIKVRITCRDCDREYSSTVRASHGIDAAIDFLPLCAQGGWTDLSWASWLVGPKGQRDSIETEGLCAACTLQHKSFGLECTPIPSSKDARYALLFSITHRFEEVA
ncbi:MAG TPA: hypothetical protein VMV27_02055 [Candidatus Binataceae bacterium]|nr:hypothetical protein [Candidatus Binataceae bacterium]